VHGRKEEENKAEDGGFSGQWKNKGDKQTSGPVSEMNDSYTDDKLNSTLR